MNLYIGLQVVFYDCDRANRDRNYSGSQEYYSEGKIICIRNIKDGREVADVQLPDGRISKSHFTYGLKIKL